MSFFEDAIARLEKAAKSLESVPNADPLPAEVKALNEVWEKAMTAARPDLPADTRAKARQWLKAKGLEKYADQIQEQVKSAMGFKEVKTKGFFDHVAESFKAAYGSVDNDPARSSLDELLVAGDMKKIFYHYSTTKSALVEGVTSDTPAFIAFVLAMTAMNERLPLKTRKAAFEALKTHQYF